MLQHRAAVEVYYRGVYQSFVLLRFGTNDVDEKRNGLAGMGTAEIKPIKGLKMKKSSAFSGGASAYSCSHPCGRLCLQKCTIETSHICTLMLVHVMLNLYPIRDIRELWCSSTTLKTMVSIITISACALYQMFHACYSYLFLKIVILTILRNF